MKIISKESNTKVNEFSNWMPYGLNNHKEETVEKEKPIDFAKTVRSTRNLLQKQKSKKSILFSKHSSDSSSESA